MWVESWERLREPTVSGCSERIPRREPCPPCFAWRITSGQIGVAVAVVVEFGEFRENRKAGAVHTANCPVIGPSPELGQQVHRFGTHLRGVHPCRGQRPTNAVFAPGRALFHRTALRHTEFQKTDLADQHTLLRRLQPSGQKHGGAWRSLADSCTPRLTKSRPEE